MTLNVNNGSLKPYHKPDDTIQYINKESNPSPGIVKHLPASIEKQLSNNSSDEKIFKEAAINFENTLNKPSYISVLVYCTRSTKRPGKQKQK